MIYLVYRWNDNQILFATTEEIRAEAFIGRLALEGMFDEDIHLIELEKSRIVNWGGSR